MKENTFCAILLVATWIVLVAGIFVIADQRDKLKAEAVKRGHAEYVTDFEDNATWRWKGGSHE